MFEDMISSVIDCRFGGGVTWRGEESKEREVRENTTRVKKNSF